MLPLEDAPFGEYLRILREENLQQNADEADEFYTQMFQMLGFTKEQLYETPFKNAVAVVEKLLGEMNRQVISASSPTAAGGPILAGKNVDSETLMNALPPHMRQFEEHKLNQMMHR